MKISFKPMITVFIFAVVLASPLSGIHRTALARGEDKPLAQQQSGFRWQAAVELTANTSSAPAEAISAFQANGVKAAVAGKQLVMDGQGSLAQLRTTLFDTASPWMDFLGGPIALNLHMPASAQSVTLKLEARNTTGYRWEINAAPGALYAESAQSTFSMRYAGYGAPAIQTIQLKGLGDGDTTVQLLYKRPFGPGEPVLIHLDIWMPKVADLELSDPTPTPVEPAGDAAAVQASSEEPDALAELLPKALPASWDWRTQGIVTPIRDQRGCGSCWAFSTVGVMESAVLKSGGPATNLSEQFLVSCNKDMWSCNGGWDSHKYHFNALGKNQTQIGAVLESAKPYTGTNGSCNVALSHPYKLSGWGYVGGLNGNNYHTTVASYDQLKNAIYTYGPISVGVCVGSAFDYYTGGLFSTNEESECSTYHSPNHMIVLVGWNDADQSLILRNSWNTWWGESGYMRIQYGASLVGISPTWVVRAAIKPAPKLSAPSGTIHTTKPAYRWSRVGAVGAYKLQVYDIATGTYRVNVTVSSSYCNVTTKLCTYTPNIPLTYNKNYKWRATAAGGTWSTWMAFKATVR
jgi:inhibitor of cysteine peptidase